MALDPYSIGGAVLGGLLSSGKSDSGSQTVNRDPWGPSQEWLKGLLGSGQNLQKYYQANPLSRQQQAAYGNQFGLAEQARQTMPGLLGQMSSTQFFDRTKPLDRPQPYSFNPGGASLGGGFQSQNSPIASPVIDYNQAQTAINQFNPQNPVMDWGGSPDGQPGFDAANNTSSMTSGLAGFLGNIGLTGISDAIAAANGANMGHEGMNGANIGNDGFDGNVSVGSDASTASDGASADGSAYAKGGMVKGLIGPNPKGKDDGYGALDKGEFVVKASSAKRHMGLLKDLNDDGKVSKKRKGLLA